MITPYKRACVSLAIKKIIVRNLNRHGEIAFTPNTCVVRFKNQSKVTSLTFYVLRFFFLAAGNNTLFKISLYPGELG